jgi:hypothetical protein
MNKIEWQRKNRQTRKENGLCITCGNPTKVYVSCKSCREKERDSDKKRKKEGVCRNCSNKIFQFGLCEKCLEKRRENEKIRRINRMANGLCSTCKNVVKKNHSLCEKCITLNKIKYIKKRNAIFKAYGNKCKICGTDIQEFLQIDHIDGGGNKHRRSLSMSFYDWLIKNNFPNGFQILCANCNQEKHQHRKATPDKIKCFNAYGGAICNCCGEENICFLEMDHIHNNGNIMRKADSRHYNICRWLRRNNYPQGYQVLCSNCNYGKRIAGTCPHQKKVKNV